MVIEEDLNGGRESCEVSYVERYFGGNPTALTAFSQGKSYDKWERKRITKINLYFHSRDCEMPRVSTKRSQGMSFVGNIVAKEAGRERQLVAQRPYSTLLTDGGLVVIEA